MASLHLLRLQFFPSGLVPVKGILRRHYPDNLGSEAFKLVSEALTIPVSLPMQTFGS